MDKALPDFVRCDAYWAREETDRPLLSSWVGTFGVVEHYQHGMASLPNGELRPNDLDFEAFRPDYERLFSDYKTCPVIRVSTADAATVDTLANQIEFYTAGRPAEM